VRDITQCVRRGAGDINVATNIRKRAALLAPHGFVRRDARRQPPGQILRPRLLRAKLREQSARAHKYHDTAYKLGTQRPRKPRRPARHPDDRLGWRSGPLRRQRLPNGSTSFSQRRRVSEPDRRTDLSRRVRRPAPVSAGREDRLLFDHSAHWANSSAIRIRHTLAVDSFMKRYYRTVMN